MLKTSREKKTSHTLRKIFRIADNVLMETLRARRAWNNVLQVLKDHNC